MAPKKPSRGQASTPSPSAIPPVTVLQPILDTRKNRKPQCIAHRGYKARYPENTLLAFRKALAAGAHALETDIHLAKDGTVVLSHDASLKRCYGVDAKIIEKTWEELKELRTVAEPGERMPRFVDLLGFLGEEEDVVDGGEVVGTRREDAWVLIDIKVDDDAEELMKALGKAVQSVEVLGKQKKWEERVVLGIWAAKYLPLAVKYLPGFPIVHIGFQVSYARQFLKVPNVGFNMVFPVLFAPWGRKFIRDCQEEYHRKVIAWTVNDEKKMGWCIRRKLDGVITDDPEKFLDVCKNFDDYSKESIPALTWKGYYESLMTSIMIIMVAWWYFRKHIPRSDVKRMVREYGIQRSS